MVKFKLSRCLYFFSILQILIYSCKKDNQDPITQSNGDLLINAIDPSTGTDGTVVTLTGEGFSRVLEDNLATLNNKPCLVIAATPTSLKITIPTNAGSGNIKVTVKGKAAQSPSFTYTAPTSALSVTSISPNQGPSGTVVTITGSGFNTNLVENTITLNGKVCPIRTANENSVTVTIPAKAGSGTIAVTVNGKTVQGQQFTYVPTWIVSTLAGSLYGYKDGVGTTAQFQTPEGVAVAADGSVYVSEDVHRIRKITPDGVVSTFAGSTLGYVNGDGVNAKFGGPDLIAMATDGVMYTGDHYTGTIRKITLQGAVSTFAGDGVTGYQDGLANQSRFYNVTGIALAADGTMYVADSYNHKIRKISPEGIVSTLAGGDIGFSDGTGSNAQFAEPMGIVLASDGNLYVADYINDKIRKITPKGEVSTIAGSSEGFADGKGASAKFYKPHGIAIGPDGILYVADSHNNRIRKVSLDGVVTTFAGDPTYNPNVPSYGYVDGPVNNARFNSPRGISIAADGTVYLSESDKIRKITLE